MTRLKRTVCPYCGHRHDLASAVTARPAPAVEPEVDDGSLSFCIGCGEISVFDSTTKGGARFPTMAEHTGFITQREILDLLTAWSAIPSSRRRRVVNLPDWMRYA